VTVDDLVTWAAVDVHPFLGVVLAFLAAVSLSYIRYDADVWLDAWDLLRARMTPRQFIRSAVSCHICSTYWVTTPALVWGPVEWLAVNGLYLLAAQHLPTLIESPDPGMEALPDDLQPAPSTLNPPETVAIPIDPPAPVDEQATAGRHLSIVNTAE
jgi:hypothetical protein